MALHLALPGGLESEPHEDLVTVQRGAPAPSNWMQLAEVHDRGPRADQADTTEGAMGDRLHE